VQDDIKRVLAYSTVAQLGYMMAALGVGGYTAGIFHLFTHGFFKALLFLGAGSLIHAVHSNNMSDMGGMRKYMPTTFWTFLVGSVALAGLPLTAGYFSKDEILLAALSWGGEVTPVGTGVFTLALLASGITAFYMARACFLIFWGTNRSHVTPHESGRWITVPLVVLAVLSLTAGWIGSPLLGEKGFESWTASEVLEEATYPFVSDEEPSAEGIVGGHEPVGPEAEPQAAPGGHGQLAAPQGTDAGHAEGRILHGPPKFTTTTLYVGLAALAIFLVAVAAAWRLYGQGLPDLDPTYRMGWLTTVLLSKYWIDDLGYRGIVLPIRDVLSRAANWSNDFILDAVVRGMGTFARRLSVVAYDTVDQKLIDGAVNGSAFSAAWWSERLKRIQSGNVQRYAGAMLAGVVVLVLVVAAAS
ncbi:MAG: hypothetical protein M3252_01485, partial [Actinomycetota bacterium]|nr:hypothetical protein [Actinomycetota bacterium]